MFLFTSLIGLSVFLYVAIKTFEMRKHPYTILAFSGAVTYAIATVEILRILELNWSSLVILPLSIVLSYFSYRLVKNMGKKSGKEILIKSLLPLTYIIVYFAYFNIGFLVPFFFMALSTVFIVPKEMKEKRRNLLIEQH